MLMTMYECKLSNLYTLSLVFFIIDNLCVSFDSTKYIYIYIYGF